jgi:hypothetical protein
MSTPEHSIAALCQRSRDISLEKGWLNPDGTDPRPAHTVSSLFHTELSEAFEDIRANKGLNELYYEVRGVRVSQEERARSVEPPASDASAFKPCGFPVELADFVIRVCQYYGSAKQGEKLSERMKELTMNAVVDNAPIENDPEKFINEMHALVSTAWLATPGVTPVFLNPIIGMDPLNIHAKALIATMAFCAKKDINLWSAIDEKEAYNRTRPIKHGGKKM